MGFGRFRSPLLPASQLIPLPLGTEMFQFPRFASRLREMTAIADCRVSPFGHPGLNACVPLPLAYRSLPRPSSPLCAQASSTCYRSLDYKSGASRPSRSPSAFAASSIHVSKQSTLIALPPDANPASTLRSFPSRVSTQNSQCFAASASCLLV